jgi:prepilin signal peptidase PulO-like enzyme (type II secretory pathway)
MRVALGIAIAVWTLAAWGGRIGLLTSDDGVSAWIRIGGSLLIGLFAAATLLIPQLEGARRGALIVFSLFTMILWARSLIVNWAGDGSLPFKLVHSVLALGFFALAWCAFSFATGSASSDPQPAEAHQDTDV